MPQAHGCQPEPSKRCPQPPNLGIARVSKKNPHVCMYSIVRKVPIRRVANRAKRSADPQDKAVAKPKRIPMANFQDLDFLGSRRPSSAITFCKSFQTSAFAGGLRSKYAG